MCTQHKRPWSCVKLLCLFTRAVRQGPDSTQFLLHSWRRHYTWQYREYWFSLSNSVVLAYLVCYNYLYYKSQSLLTLSVKMTCITSPCKSCLLQLSVLQNQVFAYLVLLQLHVDHGRNPWILAWVVSDHEWTWLWLFPWVSRLRWPHSHQPQDRIRDCQSCLMYHYVCPSTCSWRIHWPQTWNKRGNICKSVFKESFSNIFMMATSPTASWVLPSTGKYHLKSVPSFF